MEIHNKKRHKDTYNWKLWEKHKGLSLALVISELSLNLIISQFTQCCNPATQIKLFLLLSRRRVLMSNLFQVSKDSVFPKYKFNI